VVLEELRRRKGYYDPRVLAALEEVCRPRESRNPNDDLERDVPWEALKPGMTLASDLKSRSGRLVFAAGTKLGAIHIEMLEAMDEFLGIDETIRILGD
jgi:hypothetical protein